MSLMVTIDISSVIERYSHIAEELTARVEEEVEKLTYATHTHIAEEARTRLHSTRDIFMSNFPEPDQLDPQLWEIKILGKSNPDAVSGGATWIEDGLNAGFDMLPGFLASPKAKNGKNGKYLIIPFKHNKGASSQTPVQKFLADTIKKDLGTRKPKIPFGLEKNQDGTAQIGLLHKLNIDVPMNKAPIDKRTDKPWKPSTGSGPLLDGISIQQKESTSAGGSKSTSRDIMTFRTASASQQGQKWLHPGLEPMKFLDEAAKWAQDEWDKNILPKILQEFGINE